MKNPAIDNYSKQRCRQFKVVADLCAAPGRARLARPTLRLARPALASSALLPNNGLMRKYTCQCGGAITGPPPERCPHCGATIRRIRQRVNVWPLVIIAMFFASLLAFALWLLGRVH